MLVRTEVQSDATVIEELYSRALPDRIISEAMGRLRQGPYFKREFSCVLDRDGELLGCAFLCPAILQCVGRAFKTFVLMPVTVWEKPDCIRVGERLARHGIQRGLSLGGDVVLAMGPSPFFKEMDLSRPEEFGIEASLPVPDSDVRVHIARPGLREIVKGRVLLPPGIFLR
jgi:predicted N-acetyltransferase YhbS